MKNYKFSRRRFLFTSLCALSLTLAHRDTVVAHYSRYSVDENDWPTVEETAKLFKPNTFTWSWFWLTSTHGSLMAMGVRCPHEECLVRWDEHKKEFWCPCCGSHFATDGTWKSGASKKALDIRRFEIDNFSKQIIVDYEFRIRRDRDGDKYK